MVGNYFMDDKVLYKNERFVAFQVAETDTFEVNIDAPVSLRVIKVFYYLNKFL